MIYTVIYPMSFFSMFKSFFHLPSPPFPAHLPQLQLGLAAEGRQRSGCATQPQKERQQCRGQGKRPGRRRHGCCHHMATC